MGFAFSGGMTTVPGFAGAGRAVGGASGDEPGAGEDKGELTAGLPSGTGGDEDGVAAEGELTLVGDCAKTVGQSINAKVAESMMCFIVWKRFRRIYLGHS